MVELTYQVLPLGTYLALVGLAVLLFGWTAFSRPLWGLSAVFIALPLQKTAGADGFIARFALVDIFTLLTLAGTVVALARRRETGWEWIRLPRQFVVGIGLFFLFVALSFLVTETPKRSFVETTAYVVNVFFFALIVFHIRTRDRLFRFFTTWEIAVAVVSVFSLWGMSYLFQGQMDSLLTNGPKLTSTFKKSGQLSAYLMVSLPVLWFQFVYRSPSRRLRFWRGLHVAVALLSLFATGSRSGLLIGIGITLMLFGGRWTVSVLSRRTTLKLVSAAFVVMLLVPVFQGVYDDMPFAFRRALSIFLAGDLESLESLSPTRHYQMVGFETAASEYPLTGVGVGDFRTRNTALAPGAWTAHEIHNTYLGVWAETGLFGIAALFVFFLAFAQGTLQVLGYARDDAMRGFGTALAVALVTLYAYGISHFGLRMRHLWMTFGLIVAAWNVIWWEARALQARRAEAQSASGTGDPPAPRDADAAGPSPGGAPERRQPAPRLPDPVPTGAGG